MSDFADKARSIATPRSWGQSRKKAVVSDDDGTKAGYHVEHWDDRQDAVAQPKTVEMKLKMEED